MCSIISLNSAYLLLLLNFGWRPVTRSLGHSTERRIKKPSGFQHSGLKNYKNRAADKARTISAAAHAPHRIEAVVQDNGGFFDWLFVLFLGITCTNMRKKCLIILLRNILIFVCPVFSLSHCIGNLKVFTFSWSPKTQYSRPCQFGLILSK